MHSFSTLVPPDEYFAEHPEYFSLVGGERTSATVHGQLCLTNADVLRIATERVLQWVEEHAEVPIFDVSQNDGNGACECANCVAVVNEEGSQHGPILRFVNAIADEVAKAHPDKWVETLAYAYATKPPAITRPRENVIIRLCHAGCYYHGFERCGLGSGLTENLREWSELTDRVFIWHYATNFAHYLAPNPNLHGLALDIRYYADSGVNGLMVQGDYQSPGGELAELRQYLAAQLMWDPTRDPSAIRAEFCRGYYGAAADQVLTYLARLDEEAERPDVHAFGAWGPETTVSPEFVKDGLAILSQARAAAETPEVRDRVGKLILSLWYVQLTYPQTYGLDPAEAGDIITEIARLAGEYSITHVREGGESMSAWVSELAARYADVPESLVHDLYLLMDQATVTNCLDWRPATVEHDGRTLLSIFQHPPAEGHGDAVYELTLPVVDAGETLMLQFATAVTGPTEDGVRFSLLIDDREVWDETRTDLPAEEHEIDLTESAGKTIALTLRVEPIGNEASDWANWVRPSVVVVD